MSNMLKLGTMIAGRYRVERPLGHGAHGEVYLCRDLAVDRGAVALKVLRPPGGGARGPLRSVGDLTLLPRLKHPNLARVLDVGRMEGTQSPFVVYEFAEGTDFYSGSAGWPVDRILRSFATLCRVMGFLHDQGIVHRDLKPSNIVIRSTPAEFDELRLVDFGLACRNGAGGDGTVDGTIAYSAPELFLGRNANPRSDIYSLGILLYELLTRRLPFDTPDTGYLVQMHLQCGPDLVPIEQLPSGAALARVVAALLEKEPEKRPASCDEVIRLLTVASGVDLVGHAPLSQDLYFSSGSFVGREKELALLQERAGRVKGSGRGWTVFLVGESGAGKTRCMEEFRTWALLEGWRVVEGECASSGSRSYGPFRQIVARTPEAAGSEGSAEFQFEAVLPDQSLGAGELERESAGVQLRDRIAREVVRRVADKPTIVLLHDFHWADDATTAVLDYLTSDVLVHPILLCVSVRQGEHEQRPIGRLMALALRQSRGEQVALEPLSDPEIAVLIRSMLGESECSEAVSRWVIRSIGGNPFFIEQTLKHLVDREVLRHQNGNWHLLEESLSGATVPGTIVALIRRRVSQLSSQARDLARWLSVIGRPVPVRILDLVGNGKKEADCTALPELVTRQLVTTVEMQDERVVTFLHSSIGELIRSDLSRKHRNSMHLRIGQLFERFGEASHLEEIAYHLIEGRGGRRALEFALRAIHQSKTSCSDDRVYHLCDFILSHERRLPPEQVAEIALEAAEASLSLGLPSRAIKILRRRIRSVRTLSRETHARLLASMAGVYRHEGDLDRLRRVTNKALDLLTDCSSIQARRTRATLFMGLAHVSMSRSEIQQGLGYSEHALAELSSVDEPVLAGRIFCLISAIMCAACDFRSSRRFGLESVSRLEGQSRGEQYLSAAYSMLGTALHMMGRFQKAQRAHERALEISERSRSVAHMAQAQSNLAECLCRVGSIRPALRMLDSAQRLARDSANPTIMYACKLAHAEAYLAAGDYGGARQIFLALGSPDNPALPVYVRSQDLFLRATLAFRVGRLDEALKMINKLKRLGSGRKRLWQTELGIGLEALVKHAAGQSLAAVRKLSEARRRSLLEGWPVQTCILTLNLSEVLLSSDAEAASRYAEQAVRLADAMGSVILRVSCNLQVARCHRTMHSLASRKPSPVDPRLFRKADHSLERAQCYAEELDVPDLSWLVYAERARLCETEGNTAGSHQYSQQAIQALRRAQQSVASDDLDGFVHSPQRSSLAAECEARVRRIDDERRNSRLRKDALDQGARRVLGHIRQILLGVRDRDTMLGELVDLMIDLIGMERALVFLRDPKTGHLQLAKGRNVRRETVARAEAISRGVLDRVCKDNTPFVTANAASDPRISQRESVVGFKIGTLFCGPLCARGKILGAVYADHRQPLVQVSQSTIGLFSECCGVAATALEEVLSTGLHRRVGLASPLSRGEIEEPFPEIVGRSELIREMKGRITAAAVSPLSVLIWGESGTGKELVARALHKTSDRRSLAFVSVDCGVLSESLLDSELFGYRRGAFTGAVEDRRGLIEAANGGTLFLDELSNLSFRLQAKLLRVLQEREVRRLGDTVTRRVDIRVVAATNVDPRYLLKKRRLREDLYYRLNAIEIRVPALRERPEDIPLLIDWCLGLIAAETQGTAKTVSPQAMNLLVSYSYPGNVRQLMNVIAGGYCLATSDVIEVENLHPDVRDARSVGNPDALEGESGVALYAAITSGEGDFDTLVRIPYLKRKLSARSVRGLIEVALRFSNGRYRDAFQKLGIPGRRYSATLNFLKRHSCYLDFKPFRGKPSD